MKHTNDYMVKIYDNNGNWVDTDYFRNIVHAIDCVIDNTIYSSILHANIVPTMWIYSDTENDYIRICDFNYNVITKTRCIEYVSRMWVHHDDKNTVTEKNALAEIESTRFEYM